MSITKERKAELIKDYGDSATDSGSPAVQVAILTDRILYLTDHMKTHKKRLCITSWSVKDGRSTPSSAGLY